MRWWRHVIAAEISQAWVRYLKFAILVVASSSGVRIHELEGYISPGRYEEKPVIPVLTNERWVLEVCRTIIESLLSIAWMPPVFFVVALLAHVVVRIFESHKAPHPGP